MCVTSHAAFSFNALFGQGLYASAATEGCVPIQFAQSEFYRILCTRWTARGVLRTILLRVIIEWRRNMYNKPMSPNNSAATELRVVSENARLLVHFRLCRHYFTYRLLGSTSGLSQGKSGDDDARTTVHDLNSLPRWSARSVQRAIVVWTRNVQRALRRNRSTRSQSMRSRSNLAGLDNFGEQASYPCQVPSSFLSLCSMQVAATLHRSPPEQPFVRAWSHRSPLRGAPLLC